jgi:hypothetical protein
MMMIGSARLALFRAQEGEELADPAVSSDASQPSLDTDPAPPPGPLSEPAERWRGVSESLLAEAAKVAADGNLKAGPDFSGTAKDAKVQDALGGSLSWIVARPLDGTIADALNLVNGALGKGHEDARSEFWKQAGELTSRFGPDADQSFPARPAKSDAGAPDMPFKPDDSLYGMHDGKLDDNDDPAGGGDGQGTGGAGPAARGMDPSELHAWGEPPTPAPSAPSGATAGVGSQPATDPKSFEVPKSPNPEGAGDSDLMKVAKAAKELWDASPVHPGKGAETDVNLPKLPGDTIGFHLTLNVPPHSEYVDPDSAGSTGQTVTPEQLDAKLNGLKRPVDPSLDMGTFGEGSEFVRQPTGGLDPTRAYVDNQLGGAEPGELSSKVTTAPIDHMPGGSDPWSPGTTHGNNGGDTRPDLA